MPFGYESKDGYRLGLWIQLKRRQYKKNKLSAQQITDLEKLGMHWEVHAEHWQEMYEEARAYFKENGDLKVPRNYRTVSGYDLNQWVFRMKHAQGSLSDGQISALSAIGMTWNTVLHQEAAR